MAPDWAKLKADQRSIERTLQRNECAIREARAKVEDYVTTLATTASEVQRARSELRKAGLLKG